MLKVLKKFFGTKYDKDVKLIQPYVEKINTIYEEYLNISSDDLRNKTLEFRERIKNHLQPIDDEIAQVMKASDEEKDLSQKEAYYDQIDELKKDRGL